MLKKEGPGPAATGSEARSKKPEGRQGSASPGFSATPDKVVAIPARAVVDPTLTAAALRLLAFCSGHCDAERNCDVSLRAISASVHVDIATVISGTRALEAGGYLRVQRRGPQGSHLTTRRTVVDPPAPGIPPYAP
jgi:hypothetical protein